MRTAGLTCQVITGWITCCDTGNARVSDESGQSEGQGGAINKQIDFSAQMQVFRAQFSARDREVRVRSIHCLRPAWRTAVWSFPNTPLLLISPQKASQMKEEPGTSEETKEGKKRAKLTNSTVISVMCLRPGVRSPAKKHSHSHSDHWHASCSSLLQVHTRLSATSLIRRTTRRTDGGQRGSSCTGSGI